MLRDRIASPPPDRLNASTVPLSPCKPHLFSRIDNLRPTTVLFETDALRNGSDHYWQDSSVRTTPPQIDLGMQTATGAMAHRD